MTSAAHLPSSLADARAMILAERVARLEAETNAAQAATEAAHAVAEAARAQAKASSIEALIAHVKLTIEKLRRELYGTRSDRTARLLDQLELQLEDAEASASEDEIGAEAAVAQTTTVATRIDALFAIERAINGRNAAEQLRVRQKQSAPLVADLEAWLRQERQRLSRSASVTPAIDYMLRRWERFTGFLDDGRICLTNNAAERSLRGFALGRKVWLFAGSERGADRAAAMATLNNTAKLNDVDPPAWLSDVLTRIAGYPARRLHELLPWEWKSDAIQLPDAA